MYLYFIVCVWSRDNNSKLRHPVGELFGRGERSMEASVQPHTDVVEKDKAEVSLDAHNAPAGTGGSGPATPPPQQPLPQSPPQGLSPEKQAELQAELQRIEEEIATLRQVLGAKECRLAVIKNQLGLTAFSGLRENISRGFQDVQASNAYVRASETLGTLNEKVSNSEMYKKTQETLSQAGQRTSAALSTVGGSITRKLGDVRNSPSFRSFEEKVSVTMFGNKPKDSEETWQSDPGVPEEGVPANSNSTVFTAENPAPLI
uniref:tumor protein D54-like n=1 Tax=Myxine glutinosa TaxID=7769 RepID=UPI00358EC666